MKISKVYCKDVTQFSSSYFKAWEVPLCLHSIFIVLLLEKAYRLYKSALNINLYSNISYGAYNYTITMWGLNQYLKLNFHFKI